MKKFDWLKTAENGAVHYKNFLQYASDIGELLSQTAPNREMTLDELHEVKSLSKRICDLKAQLENLSDALNRLTPINDGLPKMSKTKNRGVDRISKLLAAKIDAENELAALEVELLERRADLLEKIYQLKISAVQQSVLTRRYVYLEDFSTIAAALRYSESHIFLLHRRAINVIKKLSC